MMVVRKKNNAIVIRLGISSLGGLDGDSSRAAANILIRRRRKSYKYNLQVEVYNELRNVIS
jgi:hypothetical protein